MHSQQEANVYVAGIDAHTKYLIVVVVSKMGDRVMGPVRVNVDAREHLTTLLAEFRPLEAVMETSSVWPWLDECITAQGIRFVLAHAKRLRVIAESTYKSDRVDAELLARMRLAGLIPEVYVTPAAQREWAALVRHRRALVGQRTTLANRIHAQLHSRGLSLRRGELLTKPGRAWVATEAFPRLSREQRSLVRTHFLLLKELRKLIGPLDRRIRSVAAQLPEARLLQSVPGIGPHRALVFCAEALPIARFATPAHLTSYAGLAPRTRQSGQGPIRHGAIPMGANRYLRGLLVQAVIQHAQYAPDSWLTAYYTGQTARLGKNVARIAAARKLARALYAMLWTNTRWSNTPPGRGELERTHAA